MLGGGSGGHLPAGVTARTSALSLMLPAHRGRTIHKVASPTWRPEEQRLTDISPPIQKMTQVLMTQTPPILHGPSDKEKKYDRQLRLWAASGQAALESANMLLLNTGAGTVGVETLKNLVLPGMLILEISCQSLAKH